MSLSKNLKGKPSVTSVKELFPLIQKRDNTNFDYRAIWKKLTTEQKEQVNEIVDEARDLKIYNHLFSAFDAKNIEAAYREQETIKRHTHALKVDGYLIPEQADRISVLVEFALLDWLKEVNDYSIKYLADIRTAIARTESDNDFDSAWAFDNIEFYLQLGLVSQDVLKESLNIVIEAGNRAHQANRNDLVEEFQILVKILAGWDTPEAQPLNPQTESWFAKQRRLFLERKFQKFVRGTTLTLINAETLPDEFGFLTNLTHITELYLKECYSSTAFEHRNGYLFVKQTSLPESVGNLTNLTQLNLEDCINLIHLPKSIGNLTNLTQLILRKCSYLTSLPESVGKLINLTQLSLRECVYLTRLPNSIGNLTNLAQLDLRNCNNLFALPESIANLEKLTQLSLSHCFNRTSLPENLGTLTSLTQLNLSHCVNLTSLPESIGKLTNLTELDLSGCVKLSHLPESIGNLPNLTLKHEGCGFSKNRV